VIFSEHFGENRMILLQTVAKWRCIKLCAIFSGTLCRYVYIQSVSKGLTVLCTTNYQNRFTYNKVTIGWKVAQFFITHNKMQQIWTF